MTDGFRGKDKLQSFTAIGVVKDGALYQVDMGDGFSPFRQPSRTAVVRTRMPGGGGGVVSRGVPLSQSSTQNRRSPRGRHRPHVCRFSGLW